MSNQYTIALILGFLPLQVLVYHVIDRWFMNRTHAIATGVERGVPIAIWQRRLLLNISWLCGAVGLQIGFHGVMAIVWMQLGRNTTGEEVKLLAYLCAFSSVVIALGWVILVPFWYSRLASTLRQAEAD